MSIDPITNASAPCDAPTRSHAAALVSLRAWHSLRRRSEYIHSMTNDHLLRVSPAHALAPLDFSDVEPEWGAFTMEHCANADAAHLSLRRVMALLLGHLGFTGCRPSVLYVMADLYVDALTRMAGAARTVVEVSHDAGVPVDVDRVVAEVQLREWAERGLSDNQEAKSRLAEEKLRVALETAGVDPLGLHDHAVLDVCRAASRLGELERRVEGRVRDMLFGTSSKPTNPLHLDDLPDPSDDPDFFTSGSFLSSILGEDILGLSSLGLTPNSATASSALVAKSRTALAALPSTSLWIKDHKTGFYYKRVTDTETDGDPEAEMVARWKGDKALEPWRPVVWIEVEQPPANEEEAAWPIRKSRRRKRWQKSRWWRRRGGRANG
ncbi:hypothetical protein BCR44DRAFT_1260880 [Catenaria anguillulae PL171]|uniref:Uncharacterized protein n=1 Tax=Catenaria anguillulae PL171 TaxID=765915 RepID=A0A1Y2HB29_9FUNG|nr:hypothetical protein BCR44DRAFT_1260880 [Catenaria anguillulae PL171]